MTDADASVRRQALGEAARVARAAVMGDETDAVCLNIADDIRALMDRAPDVDPRDAEIVRLHDLQDGLVLRVEADRARIAELEREASEQEARAERYLFDAAQAFTRGAEAMREAAVAVAMEPVHRLTYGGCRTAYEQTAERIRALGVVEPGE